MKFTVKKTNLKRLSMDKKLIMLNKTRRIAGGQDDNYPEPVETDMTCESGCMCDSDMCIEVTKESCVWC
ncbi:hypothetical protein PRUB_b0182 [Pseudoalteromonas rubra]|uniref:Uncharacterized protein n=1 Tax=Pseudoalteromonas rubra TaxID=43658 RepID=A0A8T0BZ14_9GAMM|nr:hypothetical protein [Pseudoalteromonas rubra]KAF7781076.1 hypothetical protein PRUB_b0182 [Pseudoalteromonas rubra]